MLTLKNMNSRDLIKTIFNNTIRLNKRDKIKIMGIYI